ncbi:UNVERIFIED_CONTAM: hypothetical protein GTU68_052615 [Idotea baltica]|nr:hypothetical protein [Idotea baltica]
MNKKLIDSLNLPADLRGLDKSELETIANELRAELISNVSRSGGHFASSLGATELTVALHHSFNTPNDKLIWDVGHQAYVHKMLTGRRNKMHSIRQKNGLSGFLKREESEYDTFGAGHAGTSISAAVGMAVADIKNEKENFHVPIIGDGSMTCGMAFEALNHAGELGLSNLIVVLNDNEMSIAPNVGAMSWFFSKNVTGNISTRARAKFKSLYRQGYIPELVYKTIDKAEEMTQGFISSAALLFEAFGFRYIGPVDGHSMEALTEAFENAKAQDVPVLVHVSTLKGKGFEPAEKDPWGWHATKPLKKVSSKIPTYTEVFSKSLIKIADKNSKLVAITAAMPDGTGLDKFQEAHPDKFFDVGICEQHGVTFAAGLSTEGLIPVCAIYSTFLQRAYDQVVHDVCLQELPVIFAMDRAGLVGNDGETHQGIYDLAYLRALPSITIMAPKDENELQHMLFTATKLKNPSAIRYPRGSGIGVKMDVDFKEIEIGKAEVLYKSGTDILLLAIGQEVYTAINVAKELEANKGVGVTVINMRFIKPLDEDTLREFARLSDTICCIEDHSVIGGLASAVSEFLVRDGLYRKFLSFGVADEIQKHATQDEQKVLNGFDAKSIYEKIVKAHIFQDKNIAI